MCDQSCTYCKKKTHAYILVLKDTCSQTWGNTDVRVCYNRQQLLKSDQCLAFRTFRLWLLAICQKNLWFVSGGDLFKCFISSSGCLSRSLVVCCWPWLQNIIIYVSERGEKKKKEKKETSSLFCEVATTNMRCVMTACHNRWNPPVSSKVNHLG